MMRSPSRRLVAGFFAFTVGFAGAAGAAHLTDTAATFVRGERLGLLDVDRYCIDQLGDRALAVLTRPEANEWRCAHRSNGMFATSIVDLDAACRWQYDVPSHAVQGDPLLPTTLACFYGPG